MRKLIPFAIAYDFDGTLAPGNMQENSFIPAIGMSKKKFWAEVGTQSENHNADNILVYMLLMLKKAEAADVKFRKQDFKNHGKNLQFFKGVLPYKEGNENYKGWFDRINDYGELSGISVQHFIISSGIKEIVLGTKIARKFKSIFASSFYYDQNGVANWPALALNYTSKTQYLFRINKGCLKVHDHKKINKYVPEDERPIPFNHMVYIGDGETDIPCFRVVKDRGGYSIAVYKPQTRGTKYKCKALMNEGRINFRSPADYRDGKLIDRIIKGLIDKIAQDSEISKLAKL
jgi:hypothetical protein